MVVPPPLPRTPREFVCLLLLLFFVVVFRGGEIVGLDMEARKEGGRN